MSEVQIRIGDRPFTVACQPGEEPFLEAAARLLDTEASSLVDQLGKMPETQMLLMAGLMLADKMAGLEERSKGGKARGAAKAAPMLPDGLTDRLEAMAARAEDLAGTLEQKAG